MGVSWKNWFQGACIYRYKWPHISRNNHMKISTDALFIIISCVCQRSNYSKSNYFWIHNIILYYLNITSCYGDFQKFESTRNSSQWQFITINAIMILQMQIQTCMQIRTFHNCPNKYQVAIKEFFYDSFRNYNQYRIDSDKLSLRDRKSVV